MDSCSWLFKELRLFPLIELDILANESLLSTKFILLAAENMERATPCSLIESGFEGFDWVNDCKLFADEGEGIADNSSTVSKKKS